MNDGTSLGITSITRNYLLKDGKTEFCSLLLLGFIMVRRHLPFLEMMRMRQVSLEC